MVDKTFNIVVLEGPEKGQSAGLSSDTPCLVGHAPSCTLKLTPADALAPEHLRLEVKEGTVQLQVLDDTPEVQLNGEAVSGSTSIVAGDRIQVGETVLIVDQISSAEKSDSDEEAPAEVVETQIDLNVTDFSTDQDKGQVRSYEAQPTRMLKVEELAGLRAAATKSKRTFNLRPVVGLLIVFLLLGAVVAYFGFSGDSSESAGLIGKREVRDEQFRTSLEVPFDWVREDTTMPVLSAFTIMVGEGVQAGGLILQAERDPAFEISGLDKGFLALEDELKNRHEGYERFSAREKRINHIDTISYRFSSSTRRGEGLVFFNRDSRIWLEGSAEAGSWPRVANAVRAAMETIALDKPQSYLKYDMPTLSIKRQALQDPNAVAEEAKYLFRQADELIVRRSVRPENLYRATQLLKTCMQYCEALISYPPFRDEAAWKLVESKRLLNAEVKSQRANILQAMKIKDYTRAQVECSYLMQLLPDKQSKYHKDAQKLYTKLSKKK